MNKIETTTQGDCQRCAAVLIVVVGSYNISDVAWE